MDRPQPHQPGDRSATIPPMGRGHGRSEPGRIATQQSHELASAGAASSTNDQPPNRPPRFDAQAAASMAAKQHRALNAKPAPDAPHGATHPQKEAHDPRGPRGLGALVGHRRTRIQSRALETIAASESRWWRRARPHKSRRCVAYAASSGNALASQQGAGIQGDRFWRQSQSSGIRGRGFPAPALARTSQRSNSSLRTSCAARTLYELLAKRLAELAPGPRISQITDDEAPEARASSSQRLRFWR